MRGAKNKQETIFHTFKLKDKIPADHPLRAIKQLADAELTRMSPLFREAYSHRGRPSIPPEQLLKASILQALYSIPSERQLCEQVGYNLLFQWFLDLKPDQKVWDHSSFTKNRKRFADHGFMRRFFEGSVAKAIQTAAVDTEEFSVDGTLVQSWASIKSVKPKDDDEPYDGNGWSDFQGEKRRNATHQSKTDPEAKLYKKGAGKEALLCHSMHALTDNKRALVLDVTVDEASGVAEREAALALLKRVKRRHGLKALSLSADKGYDDGRFLVALEKQGVIPLVAIRDGAIKAMTREADARRLARLRKSTEHYHAGQKARRMCEQVFNWLKNIGGLRRARMSGRWKLQLTAYAGAAAYNFMKLAKLGLA